MKQRFPGGPNPLVIPRSKYADPAHLAWKGIQNLCRLDVVSDLWIRKDDWEMWVVCTTAMKRFTSTTQLNLWLRLCAGSICGRSETGASSRCHSTSLRICRDSVMLYRSRKELSKEATPCRCNALCLAARKSACRFPSALLSS